MSRRFIAALENHLKQVPEDPRARVLLGSSYAKTGREEDAMRELNLAITLRADEASILYNAACAFCEMKKNSRKPWKPCARRGKPVFTTRCGRGVTRELALLRSDPEFERPYPAKVVPPAASGSH